MKKVIFLMISLLHAFVSMAQQNILNESVSVRFPEGSAKLSKEKAINFASEKFHNDKFALNVIQRQNSDYVYEINDVLVTFFPVQDISGQKGSFLTDRKAGLDEMFKHNKTYKSTIKSINSNQILMRKYFVKDVGYYNFLCLNNNKSRALNFSFQYDKGDTDKASALVEELLKSLTIKK